MEADPGGHFDALLTGSDDQTRECRRYVRPGAENVFTIDNGVNLGFFTPQPAAQGNVLLFMGALNYRPNVEGVQWFVERVMPRLRASTAVPNNLRFRIVGHAPTRSVERLARHAGVEVIGPVEDVRMPIREASVVVPPLQTACGIQNKVLEAMASRRAVVCSSAAATGLDVQDGKHLRIADTPEAWERALAALLDASTHRQAMAAAARRFVEQQHTWEEQLKPLMRLLDQRGRPSVASAPNPGPRAVA